MRPLTTLLWLVPAALLQGCGPSCLDACQALAKACAQEFSLGGVQFDLDQCEDDCNGNRDGCQNHSDQVECLAGATTCAAVEQCRQTTACVK